jgi:signal transduction histidine kinase
MTGFSQILREEYSEKPFDEAGREYTRRIEGGAQRMEALIRDLLSYCRVAGEKVELESLDPGPILREAARRETAGLPEGKGDIRVSGDFPRVLGNPGLLSQAFQSLVSNAVKFVGPGVSPRIEIGCERREGRVRLFVSDNGIGIEPEYHDRIFRVFERLHDQSTYPGTGMGLAIVRAAAGKLGGSAGLESKPGQGSRFWIELEAVPCPPVK